jgi:hypothetical protein
MFGYNVYKNDFGDDGQPGFIGRTLENTVSNVFVDNGISPDYTLAPPTENKPFESTDNYPAAVSFFQQRMAFANTRNNTQGIWLTRPGIFNNLTTSFPLQNDDAIAFSLVGRQVQPVRHLVDLGAPTIFTDQGEWALQGAGGVITPFDLNPKQYDANGANRLSPIVTGASALFVQARGQIVRDLAFDFQVDGYRGNDLTVFASHLFDNRTLLDWTYQKIPHSNIWCVRDDGKMLSLTYVREQSIIAWAQHDTDGIIESVCAIPEGNEDVLYMVVKRTIDGEDYRYVERMATRNIVSTSAVLDETSPFYTLSTLDPIVDYIGLDCSVSYDGRNNDGSHTVAMSGGTTWAYDETLTLTTYPNDFTAEDVGNQVFIWDQVSEDLIRFTITGYTNSTTLTGTPHKTVPVSMRGTGSTIWARAVNQLDNLWHLEGKDVSVFGDGTVVASPNNSAYETITVTNGSITLDQCYAVIHVGLPFTVDLETLDIDTPNGETISDKNMLVSAVTARVEKTRGLFFGSSEPTGSDALEGLYELKLRANENYDQPVDLKTGKAEIVIRPEWNSNGRVFMRQVDPLPATILSVAVTGLYPFKRSGG